MAEEVLIRIRVDATELEQFKEQIKGATNITEEYREKLKTAFDDAIPVIVKAGDTINSLKDKLSKMKQELGTLPIGSEEFKNMKVAVMNLETRVKELGKSIKGIDFYQMGREAGKMAIGVAKIMTGIKAIGLDGSESMQALIATIAKGTAVVQGMRGAVIAVTGAYRLWGQAVAQLSKIMRTTPVGAVITLFLALAAALGTLLYIWSKSTDEVYKNGEAHKYLTQVLEEELKVLSTMKKQLDDANALRQLELNSINEYEAARLKVHAETNKSLLDIDNRNADKIKEFALKAKKDILDIDREIAKNRLVIEGEFRKSVAEERKKLGILLEHWDKLSKEGRMNFAKQLGISNEETLRFIRKGNKDEIKERALALSNVAKDYADMNKMFAKERIEAKKIELAELRNLEIQDNKKRILDTIQWNFDMGILLAQNKLGNSKDLEKELENKNEILKQGFEKERDLELIYQQQQIEILKNYKKQKDLSAYGTYDIGDEAKLGPVAPGPPPFMEEISKTIPEDPQVLITEQNIQKSKTRIIEITKAYLNNVENYYIEHYKFMTELQQQFDIELSRNIETEVKTKLAKAETFFQEEKAKLISHNKSTESLEKAYEGIKNDIFEEGEKKRRELLLRVQEAEAKTNDEFTKVRLRSEENKWDAIRKNSKSSEEELEVAEKVYLANINKIVEEAESKKKDIILKANKDRAVTLEENYEADLALLQKAGEDKLKVLYDVNKESWEQSKEYDAQLNANIQEQNQLEIDFVREKEQFMFDIHLEYLDKTARTNRQVKEMQLAEEEKFYKDQLAIIEASISTKDEKETAAAEATATHEAVVRKIREEAAAKISEDIADVAAGAADLGATVAGIMDQIARKQEGADKKEMNNLKNKNVQKLNSFKGTEKQKEALQKKIIQEEYELEVKQMARREEMARKQFLIQKATAAASAVVNIASAVAAALTAGPGVGIAMSIVTAALGAIQLATILSARFDDSNYTVETPSMPSGGAGSGTGGDTLGPTLAFGQSGKQPETVLKTYVIGSEVTTQQALDRQTLKNGLLV